MSIWNAKKKCVVRCGCKHQGTYTIYFVSVIDSIDVTAEDAIYSITILTRNGARKNIRRLAKSGSPVSDFSFTISSTLDTADDTYADHMKKIVDIEPVSAYVYSNFVGKGSIIDFSRAFWKLAKKLANPTEKLPSKENVHFTRRHKGH